MTLIYFMCIPFLTIRLRSLSVTQLNEGYIHYPLKVSLKFLLLQRLIFLFLLVVNCHIHLYIFPHYHKSNFVVIVVVSRCLCCCWLLHPLVHCPSLSPQISKFYQFVRSPTYLFILLILNMAIFWSSVLLK